MGKHGIFIFLLISIILSPILQFDTSVFAQAPIYLDDRCQTGFEQACIDLGYCVALPCGPPIINPKCTGDYPYLWSDGQCWNQH